MAKKLRPNIYDYIDRAFKESDENEFCKLIDLSNEARSDEGRP
jgi:hypothetical protein